MRATAPPLRRATQDRILSVNSIELAVRVLPMVLVRLDPLTRQALVWIITLFPGGNRTMVSFRRGVLFLLFLAIPALLHAQGVMLSSFGPVNAGMGGASTAAPIEALSALAWNPASISGLPNSELSVGLGLMLSDPVVDSSIAGLGRGSTGAEPGVVPLPNIGWVHKVSDTVTIGMGVMVVGGLKSNYPGSLTNPVLTPGLLGSLYTDAQYLQLAPVFSYAVTERLSIGFGPSLTLGQVIIDPLLSANPNDANGDRVPSYPSGRGTRFNWGGGAQLGVYYITDRCWHLGASIKSPQWMEDNRVHTEDEIGVPYTAKFNFDLPMIVSVGTAYSGFENTIFAVDVRYMDYQNTAGFGDSGYGPYGKLNGLNWDSQWVLAAGVQRRLSDSLLLRLGYTFNTSPFGDNDTFYNVGAPLNYQHQLGMGGTWELSDCVAMHWSYTHYFQYDSTGPIILPTGAIPGSSVTNTVSADIASLGLTVKY